MYSILIKSLLLFFLCLSLHILIWRIKPPATYSSWLPILFVIFIPLGGVAALWMVTLPIIPGNNTLISPWLEWAAIFLFQVVASMVYIIGYTAITTFGPSIELLKALEDSAEGLSYEKLTRMSSFEDALSDTRIKNLIASNVIVEEGGYLRLAWRGRSIVGPVLLYRRLIGLPDGGGG